MSTINVPLLVHGIETRRAAAKSIPTTPKFQTMKQYNPLIGDTGGKEELSYDQVIELESNIKLKNEAEVIYRDFLNNIKLEPGKYKGDGKFLHWSDSHNAMYFQLRNDTFHFICTFLHESYSVEVTPSGIFSALKKKYRGVEHLESIVSTPIQ